ncbi:MAG TPA: protein kinase [Terriglobales bacterium]|nr:protein kinase [Terriglobales bacterium]
MGSPLAKPARIGKYDIVSVIGRGGMGVVYHAMDPRIGRPVAIKVLTGALGEDQDLLARFYREARYTGGLQHQNIVTVYEFGEQDGFPFLVMEYLEGESLEDIITSRRTLLLAEKLGIIVQVCNGLSFAHQRGVVHRDIKPANIVVQKNGTAKIVDFGIAHVGGHRLTRTGQVVGSIYYMSPEQLSGNVEVDFRTDVYSIGVVLFQLLTGTLPFQGSDTGSTLLKIVHDPPPLLSNFIEVYPPELEPIIQKALAKDRELRYAAAADFGFELERLQQELNREVIGGHLEEASHCVTRKEFSAAREQLLRVLRIDSQNATANKLLRDIQQGLEQQRRQQQLKQLVAQAEAACGYKQFDTALEYVKQGLEVEPGNPELQNLSLAIQLAQKNAIRYNDALSRAEGALSTGDLDGARNAIGEVLEIDAANPRGRTLAASIARKIDERARQQKAAQAQAARATNLVEKALADARMHIFLDQDQEAQEALEKASRELGQVPRELQSQWEALQEEIQQKIRARLLEGSRAASAWGGQSGVGEETTASINLPAKAKPGTPANQATRLFGNPDPLDEVVHKAVPFSELSPENAKNEIPEDLKEFLPPQRASRWRSGAWIAIAVLAFAAASYFIFWPKPSKSVENSGGKPPSGEAQPAIPEVTFAVINAEPWGTIKAVIPANGDPARALNSQTPLRLDLPAGRYTVKVDGPKGEKQELEIEVPRQGGKTYFLFFRKPDIARMVNAN